MTKLITYAHEIFIIRKQYKKKYEDQLLYIPLNLSEYFLHKVIIIIYIYIYIYI